MEVVNKVIGYLIMIVVVACIQAIPLYFLWNYFIDKFHWPHFYTLDIWEAVGMSTLASCLFSHSSSSKSKD